MSKFGWSYPPGVTESMLPGNSPEDQKQEALCDAIYDCFGQLLTDYPDDRRIDDAVVRLLKLCSDIYADGYKQGQADEAMAQEHHYSPQEDETCIGCGQIEAHCECAHFDSERK